MTVKNRVCFFYRQMYSGCLESKAPDELKSSLRESGVKTTKHSSFNGRWHDDVRKQDGVRRQDDVIYDA